MTALVTVVETAAYLSKAERLMSDAERASVIDLVANAPDAGAVIRGMGGVRKLRIPLAGRGKRGGGRLIYWFHSPGFPAVLLWLFAKNEAADLTSEQRKRLSLAATLLIAEFGGQS